MSQIEFEIMWKWHCPPKLDYDNVNVKVIARAKRSETIF